VHFTLHCAVRSSSTDVRTANAVARVENLEFLTDVVPKTQTFKQYKQKQAKDGAATKENNTPLPNGQKTLDNHVGTGEEEPEAEAEEAQATNGASHDAMDVDEVKETEGEAS